MIKYVFLFLFSLFCFSAHTTNIEGIINSDTTWSGTVIVTADVTVIGNHTLTISNGTIVLLKKGANIIVTDSSSLLVNGTSLSIVQFKCFSAGDNFGALKARGPQTKIQINYADIQSGQVAAYDTAEVYLYDSYLHDYISGARAIVYTNNADTAYVGNCHFSNYYETNFVETITMVENCLFEYMIGDGIDFDNSPTGTTIRLSTLRHGNGFNIDAIDWGTVDYDKPGSIGKVDRCLIYDISDKAISIGEKCIQVIVTGTVVNGADAGVSVKDSSIAIIYNNTFYVCRMGIESRQEREGMGGGHYTAYDNIIWNCTEPLVLEDGGTGQVDYSILNTSLVYPGTNNLNTNPLFVNEDQEDFTLQVASPAVSSGSISNNRGAIFPNGSTVSLDADYLSLGSPSRNSVFKADSLHPISWTAGTNIVSVDLSFSSDKGNTWQLLANNISASQQKYFWTVPNIYSTKCLIKIVSSTNTLISDSSYSAFTILPKQDTINLISDVVFSDSGGFYNSSFNLGLLAEPGAIIYYTLDGSEPTDKSLVYTSPILIKPDTIHTGYPEQDITSTTEPQFPLSYIRTSPVYQTGIVPGYWVQPQIDLFKAQVVKARAYVNGKGLSNTTTHTYFVDPNINTRFNMPVISISTNKENLFDYYDGIYVPGVDFKGTWFTGNFERRGRDWEKYSHVEMYEPDGKLGFSLNAGIRVKGEWIRSACYKSLQIYPRSEYDTENEILYDVFKGMNHLNSSIPLKKYKRLIFRNAGNNVVWPNSNPMFRDGFVQKTIEHLNIKTQGFRPAVLFINGEYWGIHNIMEDNDSRSFENHFGFNKDSVVIMEHNLSGPNQLIEGRKGDEQEYIDLVNFITSNDLGIDSNYDYFLSKVDSNSFCDHWVATIFAGKSNFDHNVTFWKYKGLVNEENERDGKWRFAVNDFDAAFIDPTYDSQWAVEFVGPNYLFSNAMLNTRFKNMFINRMADQLNSAFKTNYLLQKYNEMHNDFLQEIDKHIDRWKSPLTHADWDNTINVIRDFIIERPGYQKQFIMNRYILDSLQYNINVTDQTKGYITINTLKIDKNTMGLADSSQPYPWVGTYFKTIPVRLKATSYPGYKFVRWLETNETSSEIIVNAISDTTYTAVFEIDTNYIQPKKLYINELMAENNITINDNNGLKKDWIEIYNDREDTVDLADYVFTDGYVIHRIPSGNDSTKIAPKGFKLFWADNKVKEGVLHLNFKLSKQKDQVMLYAPDKYFIEDSITYTNQIGDISFGRVYDGAPQWTYFYKTTPGASNVLKIAKKRLGFNLYPIPATNELNILLEDIAAQKIQIQISDMLGKVLLTQEVNYKPEEIIKANVSQLTMGFYCISISGEGISQRVLFTKQ